MGLVSSMNQAFNWFCRCLMLHVKVMTQFSSDDSSMKIICSGVAAQQHSARQQGLLNHESFHLQSNRGVGLPF